MQVVGYDAIGHGSHRRAPCVHVLTDGGDHFLDRLFDGQRAARILHRHQFGDIAVGLRRDRRDLAHHVLELVVAGDEVGLRVDFDDGARLALGYQTDQPFGGHAARLRAGLDDPLLAQEIDGILDVALGFAKCLLAVHHAGAAAFAQLFHHGCGNVGHVALLG